MPGGAEVGYSVEFFDLTGRTVPSSLLAGAEVHDVELRDGTLDLLIDFDGERSLEIIPISSGYESWQFSAPNGMSVIAQGGGNLVVL